MPQIVAISPQRRGFTHHFRVCLDDVDPANPHHQYWVWVAHDELLDYHRFQQVALGQTGWLCRFDVEFSAETAFQLRQAWSAELAAAHWPHQSDADQLIGPPPGDL